MIMAKKLWHRKWTVVALVAVLVVVTVPGAIVGADSAPGDVECLRDWGDAPDSYKTWSWNNGARHELTGPFMGQVRDGEDNGRPDNMAEGDDNAGSDDEDGVCCFTPLLPGVQASVKVKMQASQQACTLSAWIDFGRDGSWGQTGDQLLFVDGPGGPYSPPLKNPILQPSGEYVLYFMVPQEIEFGATYARFRCASSAVSSYYGWVSDGEVEDYRVELTERPMDCGDLPNQYGTLMGSDGAFHWIVDGFGLGQTVDGEANGAPSAGADGDDLCGALGDDDEDGVAFTTALNPGNSACVEVTVQDGAGLGGIVDAWIDFYGNGWAGATKIIDGELVLGTEELCFDVPGDAPTDQPVYARFRVSRPEGQAARGPDAVSAVGPTGDGGEGELEDYMLTLVPTAVRFSGFGAASASGPIPVALAGLLAVTVTGATLFVWRWRRASSL